MKNFNQLVYFYLLNRQFSNARLNGSKKYFIKTHNMTKTKEIITTNNGIRA